MSACDDWQADASGDNLRRKECMKNLSGRASLADPATED